MQCSLPDPTWRNRFTQFSQKLKTHEKAAKHAPRYLNGTFDQSITYNGNLGMKLECWNDANWGGEEGRESVSGFVLTMAGGQSPTHRRSPVALMQRFKMQHLVNISLITTNPKSGFTYYIGLRKLQRTNQKFCPVLIGISINRLLVTHQLRPTHINTHSLSTDVHRLHQQSWVAAT